MTSRAVMRYSCRALAAAAVCAVGAGHAQAQAQMLDSAVIGRAEIVADVPPGGPIEGEMVLLHLRAIRKGRITLEELRQPALTNLSWTQLGRDSTFESQFQGFTVPGVARDLAVFPQRPGPLTIDPFVLHMTALDAGGERVEVDLASEPVTLDIVPIPKEARQTHWLPASEVTLSDSWDKPADELRQGDVAHRVLRIEARGLTADRLPPPPLMRAPGIIAYAYPVERTTEITPQGPIGRARYQWDVKPVSQDAANLPAIEIPWFDTRARQMRTASVAPVKVKLLSLPAAARPGARAGSATVSMAALLVASVGACLWGLAMLALARAARRRGRPGLLQPF